MGKIEYDEGTNPYFALDIQLRQNYWNAVRCKGLEVANYNKKKYTLQIRGETTNERHIKFTSTET